MQYQPQCIWLECKQGVKRTVHEVVWELNNIKSNHFLDTAQDVGYYTQATPG